MLAFDTVMLSQTIALALVFAAPYRIAMLCAEDRTRSEKERYHKYGSAEEVIRMYKDDLNSQNAKPVNQRLKELGLAQLSDVREQFERKAA